MADTMNAPEGPFDARDSLFPVGRRRVRMALSDGHMDVCISPDVSPETLDALRRVGEAALDLMKEENDGD